MLSKLQSTLPEELLRKDVWPRTVWFLKLLSHFEQILSNFGWNYSTRLSKLHSTHQDEQLHEKHLFLGIKYQSQFLFRKKNLDHQRKKNQQCQTCIECVRTRNSKKKCSLLEKLHVSNFFRTSRPNCMKKCFFWISYIFTHLFGLWRKHNRNRGKKFSCGFSKLPCTCLKDKLERSDFLWNISISYFFQDFEQKISSSVCC